MNVNRYRSLAAALSLSAAACTSTTTQSTTTGGTSRVLLTDDPFPYDSVARVDLYVVSVSGSVNADTSASAGGNFFTLASPHRLINLLALQNGITDELGSADLPTGAITAVRLIIDTDSSSITMRDGHVLTSTSTPGIHWQSSAGRPVLNAVIGEQIVVHDTGAVIVVDYDVGRAFIRPQEIDPTSTDHGFIFSPILDAADANRTGSISGTVHAHTSGGAPVANASLRLYLGDPSMPENTWGVVATARSAADGSFRFAYAPRSAFWAGRVPAGRTYIVAADPPRGAGLGRLLMPNVQVTARADTPLGTLVLP